MAKRDYIDYLGLKRFKENLDIDLDKKVDISTYETDIAALKENISDVQANGITKENLDTLGVAFDEDLDSFVTMDEVLAKVGSAYQYKGSKASLAVLLEEVTEPEVGDVYNLEDTGMNAAWTGEAWDELGSTIDLSDYLTKDEIERITEDEIDELFRTIITSITSLSEGGLVTVEGDLTTNAQVTVASNSNIKLNGTITPSTTIWGDNSVAVLRYESGDHTISGSGTLDVIEDDSYGIDLVSGTLTIEGDVTIYGNVSCVQVESGTCYIKGGNFELRQVTTSDSDPKGTRYMLNLIDAAAKAGTAAFVVTGGRFKNFDPSASADGNLVADGYTVTSEVVGEDTYYTVSQV